MNNRAALLTGGTFTRLMLDPRTVGLEMINENYRARCFCKFEMVKKKKRRKKKKKGYGELPVPVTGRFSSAEYRKFPLLCVMQGTLQVLRQRHHAILLVLTSKSTSA